MTAFSREFIQSALGFTTIVTDSRKIRPGCLFVALKGERFDGHDFVGTAIQGGATGCLVASDFKYQEFNSPGVSWLRVADTQEAFRELGAAWRRRFDIPVVVVAGSVGKTTTKELLASILGGKFKSVLKTQGSQNGFLGIPMTLLELRPEHGAAVVEVGIDEIGAMHKHLEKVSGTAALLTAIGPEHLEKLIDLPTVAREEALALTEIARARGLVAINLDDPWIAPLAPRLKDASRSVTYGLHSPEAELRGVYDASRSRLEVSGLGSFEVPLLGSHNALNLLGALALAHGLGLSADEMRAGLARFGGVSGRSEVKTLRDGIPVLCDYYNANPTSTAAALEVLRTLATGRRWACLGDMLELGPDEEKFHRSLAERIVALGIEHVHLHGPRMNWLRDELTKRGFSGKLGHHATHAELAQAVIAGIRPGDALLIKGSRGMKMEEVWKVLQTELA